MYLTRFVVLLCVISQHSPDRLPYCCPLNGRQPSDICTHIEDDISAEICEVCVVVEREPCEFRLLVDYQASTECLGQMEWTKAVRSI